MVRIVEPLPASGRVLRRPQHTFSIRHKPWQIQPFCLAPVLPGETLKNALLQARVVTDPLKSPLVGWWYEMYLFYVKHRDMPDSTHFQNMVLQYGYDLSPAYRLTPGAEYYHAGYSVSWVNQCQRAVVNAFFRDDGETYEAGLVGGLPAAKLNGNSWVDSVLPDAQNPVGAAIAGGTTASATDLLLQQFELMRELKLTTMTYEEFLKSYGVRPDQAETPNKPELIRYVRDWNYPSNTVDPASGTPSSAMSWSIAERADKDRYFTEPGFIYGVAVARPKVYLSNQKGSAAAMLNDAFSWLPAILNGEPQTSRKKFAQGTGPLPNIADAGGYWVDVRDLFLYGDQFLAAPDTIAATSAVVALPDANANRKYPSETDATGLFKAPTSNLVRADGVLSLTIAGSQRDAT